MLGFLEPVCRQYCSQSYYNWLGQYFWPNLLNSGSSLIEFFTELDTTGIIATGTVLVASAGGLYYCISRRNGEVHVEESATPLIFSVENDTPTIDIEEAQRLLKQQHAEEEEQKAILSRQQQAQLEETQQKLEKEEAAQRLLAQEAQTLVTVRSAARRDLPQVDVRAPSQPATSVASVVAPRQHIPKQQIINAYLKTRLSERMKHKNPSFTAEVERDAFIALGLPLDGKIPTDPTELRQYRDTMKGLGLNLNY